MLTAPRWLRRAVESVLRPAEARHRSLDAGAGGRRWAGGKSLPNLNADIAASGQIIRHRANYYAHNNPTARAAIQGLVANIVGTGIVAQSKAPPPVRALIQPLWERWIDTADPSGMSNFNGLQALAVRSMITKGECFVRLRTGPTTGSRGVPLWIDPIDPDQIPMHQYSELASAEHRDGNRIRAGIELDAAGRRQAYHVLPARPDDPALPLPGGGFGWQTERVDARDMIHLFEVVEPGQLRGVSWLTAVLLLLHELDQYQDATLVRAKVAALFAGFIRDPSGAAGGLLADGNPAAGIIDTGMEPGSLINLPSGADITFSTPCEPPSYGPFVKAHLRAVAAGFGVPYEHLSADLEGVSYSSIRAGLVEFRRRIEQLQWNVVIHQFCRPIWERFVHLAVLTGAIPADDFETNPDDYLAVTWMPPKFDYVDPLKDVNAEIAAINAGLKSRSQAIGERGYDPETVDAEIAADNARAERLGIVPAAVQAPVPPDPAAEDAPPARAAGTDREKTIHV